MPLCGYSERRTGDYRDEHSRTGRLEGYRVDMSEEESTRVNNSTIIAGDSSAGPAVVHSRAPRVVRRYRALHLTWRAMVFFVGVAIVAGGVAMLVLPGPGWAAIIVGLAVLATEFVWAQRLLHWGRRRAGAAAARAADLGIFRRLRLRAGRLRRRTGREDQTVRAGRD